MIASYPLSAFSPAISAMAEGCDCGCVKEKLIRAAKRADDSMTPVRLLTKDEKIGLAILAGVPVDFKDGEMVTSQPVGISRIGGQYHVYTIPDNDE